MGLFYLSRLPVEVRWGFECYDKLPRLIRVLYLMDHLQLSQRNAKPKVVVSVMFSQILVLYGPFALSSLFVYDIGPWIFDSELELDVDFSPK